MLKIKYFTTAQNDKDFDEFQTYWSIPLNTSNQVFHNRLIRALALTNKVDVTVHRPFDKNLCDVFDFDEFINQEKNITWNYLPEGGKKLKNLKAKRKILKEDHFIGDIVIADCLNVTSLISGIYYAKKHKKPLIGVLTDNPSYMQSLDPFKSTAISSLAKKCDGYICITKSLNDAVNKKGKPHIEIPGITEDLFRETSDADWKKYEPYFFFAGALDDRHGIYKLIEAFKALNNPNVNLVICGHSKDDYLDKEIKGCKNIFYIGTIPNQLCLTYESNSIANINPRIYDPELDKFTVPSKTIEFLSATSITISTLVKELFPDFTNDAFWVDYDYTLERAMRDTLSLSEAHRDFMITKSNETVQEKYSFRVNNKKLSKFLENQIKK